MPAMARFPQWWTLRYTKGLPDDVRERRLAEIAADVDDQHRWAAASGEAAPDRAVAWRTARGMASDLTWRRQQKAAMRTGDPLSDASAGRRLWAACTQAWFAPMAVLLAVFNVLAAIAVLTEDDGQMPGQVLGPIVMTLLAMSIVAGLLVRRRAAATLAAGATAPGRPRRRGTAFGAVVALLVLLLAFALLVVGVSTGGVPYFFAALVTFGATAAIAGCWMLVRALRSGRVEHRITVAEAMIIVGTLPALGLFWMIVPALLAVAVIAGVVGTGARLRTST